MFLEEVPCLELPFFNLVNVNLDILRCLIIALHTLLFLRTFVGTSVYEINKRRGGNLYIRRVKSEKNNKYPTPLVYHWDQCKYDGSSMTANIYHLITVFPWIVSAWNCKIWKFLILIYSDLPNNCAANLILLWGKKHLHNLIRAYTFINFWNFFFKTWFSPRKKNLSYTALLELAIKMLLVTSSKQSPWLSKGEMLSA